MLNSSAVIDYIVHGHAKCCFHGIHWSSSLSTCFLAQKLPLETSVQGNHIRIASSFGPVHVFQASSGRESHLFAVSTLISWPQRKQSMRTTSALYRIKLIFLTDLDGRNDSYPNPSLTTSFLPESTPTTIIITFLL